MTVQITPEQIQAYRTKTFRIHNSNRLSSKEEAIEFVNERGFILFHPTKEFDFPSLWAATAGDRPVPNEHDDPGHITWGWKDDLLDQRVWYYGRLLRNKMTMVSFELLPYFYALSPNYGDPDNDYLEQYKQGLMTFEAKSVYETLLENGPLNTLALREMANLSGSKNKYRFDRSVNELQKELKILPVGIDQAGRWNYAFRFDILDHYHPDIPVLARKIKTSQARKKLMLTYLQSMGAATERDITKIFSWKSRDTRKTMEQLLADGAILAQKNDTSQDVFVILPDMLI